MKPGYRTTEFWLSFALAFLGALMATGALPEDSIAYRIAGAALAAASAVGYSVARGSAKRWTR